MDLALLQEGEGNSRQLEAQRQAFFGKSAKRAEEADRTEREARREGAAIAFAKSKSKKQAATS
eukprot:9427821-Heterocapsa_arctica.AAC.1